MVNPVKSFDSVQQQAEQIIQSLDNPNVKEKPKKPKKSFGSIFSVWGKMNYPNDSLKCIQNAWYKQLVNFRAWYMPETQLTADWKLRAIGNAIKACPSRMMDDSEAMLSEYRKSQKHEEESKVLLPVMLTATALTDQPLM